jgi:hypothetical protein
MPLDLGVTTGWALFRLPDTDPIAHGTFHADDAHEELRKLLVEQMPSYSVAEKPVLGQGGPIGEALENVVALTRLVFTRQVDFVQPADWKSTPAAKTPCPRGLTTHERDAIRLGRWYIGYRLQVRK